MGRGSMLWLMDEPRGESMLPTRYYRQKAVEARQAAEAATTRAIKERLQGLARDQDLILPFPFLPR